MSVSSRAPRSARRTFFTLAFATSVIFGCSGTGAGCSTLTPIPGGHYSGPKNDNAVNVRLSAAGLNYISSNLMLLLEPLAPGGVLTLPVACIKQTYTLKILGINVDTDVYIADQNLNKACDTGEAASVKATISRLQLVPQGPDKLVASLDLDIETGKIDVFVNPPTSLCDLQCSIEFSSKHTSPAINTIAANVQFTIDTKWDKLLSFKVASLNGTQICGSSGSPAPPTCVDATDLSFNKEGGGLCGYACDVIDIDLIKQFVLGLLSPTLQKQIDTILATQACQPCTVAADCPASTDGSNTQSTCTNKVCTDPSTSKCVPRFLGTEGRLDLAGLLGKYGAPSTAQMDLSLALGSSVAMDTGMMFGTRVGLKPVNTAACVPPVAAPGMTTVPAPDFDGAASPGSGYHVGLGISAGFLNEAFWAAHQSGALCLTLSTQNVGLINTGLFKTFLPSLGKLATREGKDAPMLVALRPARPPTVAVGLGTYDPVTKKPVKPLITVVWPDLSIDFYAMIDDREARLFTLTADISLPLSLIFEGCDKVTPALGDLKMLIGNIRTANSEMLAEDPQVLGDLLPAVIGLAEPAVASALQGFALPSLGSFKLKVNEMKGIGPVAVGSDSYNHLGIYAQLMPSNMSCAVSTPRTEVALREVRQPKAADMKLDGHHRLPIPEVVLDVRALGKAGTVEFAYQVDDGLWTDFRPVPDDTLTVAHSRFLIQGQHTIQVRSRVAEDPHGVSRSLTTTVVFDWEAPEVSLNADREHNLLNVTAHDVISPASALQYAYQVGSGAPSAFGPTRPISLDAVEAQGGVTVQVKDELGNIGTAVWKVPTVSTRPEDSAALDDGSAKRMPAFGCSATGGLELLGLGLVSTLLRRRRARP